jgi:L-lysine 6-transaminase
MDTMAAATRSSISGRRSTAAAATPCPSPTPTAAAEDKSVKEIEDAFAKDPYGIAAILIEPIQGEGGDNHFRPEFFQRLRALADTHDALLIFDEVQTGMGATGSMWAFEQLGAVPDIVSFGKKTQVCGIMSTGRIDEVENNVFQLSGRINSTWGGNLVDMVRCARYLQIMKEDGLVANAGRVGGAFKEQLEQLQGGSAGVSNVRGRGLFLAFDMPDGAARDGFRQECWDAGLATLACGTRTVRFRPPLVFSDADVDKAMSVIRKVLS